MCHTTLIGAVRRASMVFNICIPSWMPCAIVRCDVDVCLFVLCAALVIVNSCLGSLTLLKEPVLARVWRRVLEMSKAVNFLRFWFLCSTLLCAFVYLYGEGCYGFTTDHHAAMPLQTRLVVLLLRSRVVFRYNRLCHFPSSWPQRKGRIVSSRYTLVGVDAN